MAMLPTDLAARVAGVRPATIRDWVRRGWLTPVGGTPRRPLYDLVAVNDAAQRATRIHAPRRHAVNAA